MIKMILLIVTGFFLLFLTGFLFMPLRLVLNSETNNYSLRLTGYLKAWLNTENHLVLKMRFFCFPVKLQFKRNEHKNRLHKSRKRLQKIEIRKIFILIQDFLTCIKIKRLEAIIDTGDFPVNAMLIPIAQRLNNSTTLVLINFQGNNRLVFIAETQIYKLLILYIKYFILTKN